MGLDNLSSYNFIALLKKDNKTLRMAASIRGRPIHKNLFKEPACEISFLKTYNFLTSFYEELASKRS